MISRITSRMRRFLRDEAGNSNTVAFAIWTPVLLITLATALEVGLYTARSTMLERGIDITTRDIRLNTGTTPQHDEIKRMICDEASIIPNCESALRLEMISRDLRNWQSIPATADCVDRALEAAPVRAFTSGQENELMVLRACAKVEPIFPMTWLSNALHQDTAGDYGIIAMSTFVQEPR
ncbi:TadE/TadG family type IV pilus assembly protein [Roseobacteraceae bacterium S113]